MGILILKTWLSHQIIQFQFGKKLLKLTDVLLFSVINKVIHSGTTYKCVTH